MNAVSIPRWQQAQEAERAWWMEPGQTRHRLADRIDDAAWYAGLLNIRHDFFDDRSVLDIGGGPLPLAAALEMDVERYDVLDPADYSAIGPVVTNNGFVSTRFAEPAEWFKVDDGAYDECWGYNVLQHVIDPAAVMATAKKAARVVRWLDWTHTPIHQIHPHSIGPDWLRAQFDGWRITFDTEGTVRRPGWSHQFIAIVAERT
jgi:hypothetical protein